MSAMASGEETIVGGLSSRSVTPWDSKPVFIQKGKSRGIDQIAEENAEMPAAAVDPFAALDT